MSDVEKQYRDSITNSGHLAYSPAGNLIVLRPGSVRLAVTLEKGMHIEGLKPGFTLATQEDYLKAHAKVLGIAETPKAEAKPKAVEAPKVEKPKVEKPKVEKAEAVSGPFGAPKAKK